MKEAADSHFCLCKTAGSRKYIGADRRQRKQNKGLNATKVPDLTGAGDITVTQPVP